MAVSHSSSSSSSESVKPMSPATNFPLRWESTGEQWWYASPIDWAAANGHYDLVRELLRIDGNHLIKLTSLRRIRRLETVWDDQEQFHGAAKCRASVARRLFHHCESKKKPSNSLIRSGYGGWLVYTAASAGDLGFVQELLDRNPLLVFGEGEYGVTDVLYAAARGKSPDVFRLLLDSATALKSDDGDEGDGVYKWEMMNRAVHAAARGGNLAVLKELLADCSDVLAYRDLLGSTILHTAAGRGQIQILEYLIETFDVITASTDNQGNTALHVAAFRGQLAAAEAMISASPQLIFLRNSSGETFLHRAVAGFQALHFRPLDRQADLLRGLVLRGGARAIVNAQNAEGRTALHAAVIGNVHSDLVHLLVTDSSVDVNAADSHGLTALDYLRQRPRTASSDVLIRQLVSAGAIFGGTGRDSDDHSCARRVIVSRLKMQGSGGSSPGSSFRISDAEIFLYAGIENNGSDFAPSGGGSARTTSPPSLELSPYHHRSSENRRSSFASSAKPSSVNSAAAQIFKQVLNWPKLKKAKQHNKSIDYDHAPIDYQHPPNKPANSSELDPPTPLRKRFSKPSSPAILSSNKRSLAVRSTQSSPSSAKQKKKLRNSVMQAVSVPRRSSGSSSFPASPASSSEKQKGVFEETDIAGPSCSTNNNNNNSKRMKSHQYYLCFGNVGEAVKSPGNRQSFKRTVSLAA